jgi:hypothetical protein
MTGLFANVIIILAEEDYVTALQVKCSVSRCLLQEHGYRNTGRMGKLEGEEKVGYGAYPAQLWMLC